MSEEPRVDSHGAVAPEADSPAAFRCLEHKRGEFLVVGERGREFLSSGINPQSAVEHRVDHALAGTRPAEPTATFDGGFNRSSLPTERGPLHDAN